MEGSERVDPPVFATTQWDLIRLAGSGDPSESARRHAARALNDLCRIYRAPILAYLKCRLVSEHDAEDLAQAFCAERISPRLLANATAEKGRFRSLLLIALKNFLHDCAEREHAQRRGGGRIQFVPLEEADRAGARQMRDDDMRFDVSWATTVVERAVAHLRTHYAERGESAAFEQLLPFLGDPASRADLADTAAALNLTDNALRVRLTRFRMLYRRFLRQELGLTVRTPDEIEPETRYLIEVLARAA